MSDEAPIFALNIMIMTFDTYYLVRDDDVAASTDLLEFIRSDEGWVHDDNKHGYTKPRTPLGG